jgi:DNA-binding protein YbaB
LADFEVFGRIQANLQAAKAMSDAAQGAAAEVALLVGTATSPDEEVTVKVDSHGMITALQFADYAVDLSADALGALVLETTRAAIADGQRQAEEIRGALPADPRSIIEQTDTRSKLDDIVQELFSKFPQSEVRQ